ncbi:MAG: hypothetical protein OEZ19_05925 [Paracoccaceae bacterium]|nr:hypothetical protein [Paracoccaceae bacterium]
MTKLYRFLRSIKIWAPRPQPLPQVGKDRFSLEPWKFGKEANTSERTAQRKHHIALRRTGKISIGKTAYISPDAVVRGRVKIGDFSAVGGGTQVGIDVEVGRHCTLNPGSVVRGVVRIGNDVRIATGAQILGFNHNYDDLERPIWQQGLSRKGVIIEDDCWIGANSLVLDGVRIGAHAIVGAGAVVSKDVNEFTIVAGNPAKPIKSRKYGSFKETGNFSEKWAMFKETVCEQMPTVLERSLHDGIYFDFPDDKPRTRHLADAVELAAMAGCEVPGFSAIKLVETLTSWQDETTGLVPGPFNEDGFTPHSPKAAQLEFRASAYAVMSTGYALEILGSRLRYPVRVAHDFTSDELAKKLSSLPWESRAWQCGAWIDHFATACFFNLRHHGIDRDMSDLRSWLDKNVEAKHGLWGQDFPEGDFLHPVNGFYRLSRGAHAQFGWQVRDPERIIDLVLAHAHDPRHLSDNTATACNVLDVVHPLFFCSIQSNHRHEEILAVARYWLDKTIEHWEKGQGMRFKLEDSVPPRLQGTEMWLAIGWLCAFLLGAAKKEDSFSPKGIHRI